MGLLVIDLKKIDVVLGNNLQIDRIGNSRMMSFLKYFRTTCEVPKTIIKRRHPLSLVVIYSLLIVLLFLVESNTCSAATFVVTKAADTNDGLCDADCSLREAIVAANSASSDDIVNFDPMFFNSAHMITLSGSELIIGAGTNLTINGPGPSLLTINANNQSRVIFVDLNATASINGLKIFNGNGVGSFEHHGGGIRAFNFTNVSLNNLDISGNRTSGQGGGIFVANSTMTVTNCTVSNNDAGSSASGIFVYESTVTITGSTIKANLVGGIQTNGGNVTLQSSTVIGNNFGGNGGGIANGGGTFTIIDSIISGNRALQGGGGVSGTNGSITITNSSIVNNTSIYGGGGGIQSNGRLTVTGSTIAYNTDNSPNFGGGGIFNRAQTTTLNITNSLIKGNTTTGDGGGIYNDGTGQNENYSLLINSSLIVENSATGKGGGVWVDTDLLFYNVTVTGNNSMSNGGGIFNSGLYTLITNVTIANNQAANGGGVQNENFLYTRNSLVANNVATGGTSRDWSGFVDSFGYNLIKDVSGATIAGTIQTGNIFGMDPLLGPLRNNGGPTMTLALRPGSPAIDKGAFVNPAPLLNDQRGFLRPVDFDLVPNAVDGNGSDIGAFERQIDDVSFNFTPFDFDGDSKTDVSIFRPAPGEWWVSRSSDGGNFTVQFGASRDLIVPTDYTGDGKTDVAFWRPSTGQWFVLRSEDFSFYAFPFGTTGDVPVPADYDGDGKSDAAVFRESSLTWFISKSSGGTDIVPFGVAGDKPVNADYDGDGKSDIAVFRPSGANGAEWWIRRSSDASVFAVQFGNSTDRAVPSDFTGDGKADVAFWRPSTGFWNVLRSEDFSYYAFPFGSNGDAPVPGDYDGDGRTDAGVFRQPGAQWFVNKSTGGTLIQSFGTDGDVPIPSVFVR